MTIDELKEFVSHGESENLEFKKSTAQIHAAMQTLSSFLNNHGGTVLIGVKDDLAIIGQMVNDGTKKELANEIQKIEPKPKINITYIPIDKEKYVISLHVLTGNRRPYTYDGRAYHRLQSTTVRMKQEEYEYLLMEREPVNIPWEKQLTTKFEISNLNKSRIKKVVDLAIKAERIPADAAIDSIENVLLKMDLMSEGKLRNAAVVLFNNDEKNLIQCRLMMARFRGIDKTSFIDTKMLYGNIFELHEEGIKFLYNYLPIAASIEPGNPYRIERPAIPYDVLREALINALCHRNYSIEGGSVEIAIYDDRVEISNIGRLPNGINLKDLTKKHRSTPRNPLIAKVLYSCQMIEEWGRGTENIIKISVNAGNPEPIFMEGTDDFFVIFPLRERIGGYYLSNLEQLTPRQIEIVKALYVKPCTSKELKEYVSDDIKQRIIQMELKALEEMNRIEREGIGRGTIWRIKF